MYPEYKKIRTFFDKALLLNNTNKTMKDIYDLSIVANKKAKYCQYYNYKNRLKGYSYRKFDHYVKTFAQALTRILRKQEKHQTIVLKVANNPHWGEVFWAILMAGFKPVLIDFRTGHTGTKNLIAQSKACAIISDDLFEYDVEKISIDELRYLNVKTHFTPVWENEVFFCSSGTTGDVKLMVYQGHNLVNQIQAALSMPEETKDLMYPGTIKILAMIPFHHIFGFVAVFLWFTFFGKTLIFPVSVAPTDLLNICRKVGITHVFSVPLLWDGVAKGLIRKAEMETPKKRDLINNLIKYNTKEITKEEAGFAASDLVRRIVHKSLLGPKVRYCISGGGYLSDKTQRLINGIGYPLYNGYGMTEIGVTSVELSSDVLERMKGTIGHPLYGIQYKIKPSDANNPNSGELWVKSNIIHVREIIGGVERPTELDEEGYFPTGDIVEVNEDGKYYIKGRIKDVIINADGENIFPDELELYFKKIPHISNLAILGYKETQASNEKIILVIEVDPTTTDEEWEDMKKQIFEIGQNLPKNAKLDDAYLCKDKLPIANNMKVKRFAIRDAIKAKSPSYVSITEKRVVKNFDGYTKEEIDEIREPLREIFGEVLYLPVFKIDDNAHWIDNLGGDSMNYVELLQKVEAKFQIKIPESLYGKLANVNDFVLTILEEKKRVNNDEE